MPRVPPFDRPATYDDLLAIPDILIAEIVDGELHASPHPHVRQLVALSCVGAVVGAAVEHRGPDGWRLLDQPEVHLGSDILVPDVAAWRRRRLPSIPDVAFLSLAPDWVCEILSPSTAALDRAKKLTVYAREGVTHAWLVDPWARTLEVLRLESGRWSILGTHLGDETVRAEPFADLDIRLPLLWGED